MKSAFLIACLLCVFTVSTGSFAQATPTAASPAVVETIPATPAAPPQESKETEAIQSYVQPSYINLARTLWALNVHNLDNNKAIDDFLMISECGLYSRFYNNEFEWKKIREATRDYLSKHKNSFSRRFEYVQPLLLDRYDFALKGFLIMPGSEFASSGRLEMSKNLKNQKECDGITYDYIKDYPGGMMVLLKQPFKLDFVRVNEDLAQEYLKILADRGTNIKEGRPAFIRFRVRFDRYIDTDQIGQNEYAIFGGVLETIEVFADRDLMFKLYEQAFY